MSAQIQSIERAAAILRVLTSSPRSLALADLATELQLPRGTVYGVLRTLQTVGFVEQDVDTRRYRLGAALLHIGSSYLGGSELRRCALGHADALARRTGESVRIGTLHERVLLIIHHVFGQDDAFQTPDVGSLMPLHATALGKAVLAHHPDVASALLQQGFTACTAATLTDPARFAAQLGEISKCGWASDIGEFLPGVASIAAPIEGRRNLVVGAIAISGPVTRICHDGSPRAELAGYVMETARRISRELGASRW